MDYKIINIDLYFQFLPVWAQRSLCVNLKKHSETFFQSITNLSTNSIEKEIEEELEPQSMKILSPNFMEKHITLYTYPTLISIQLRNIQGITEVTNELGKINPWIKWVREIMRKPLKNLDKNKMEEFLGSLREKDEEFHEEKNQYYITKSYNSLEDIIRDFVQLFLKNPGSYPKSISWSPLGNYSLPRPIEAYGYRLNNEQTTVFIQGKPFSAASYYTLNLDKMETIEERMLILQGEIYALSQRHNVHFLMEGKDSYEVLLAHYNPMAILGTFDLKYLALPEDLIFTSLWEHNRAYGVTDLSTSKKKIANKFLFFIDYKKGMDKEKITREYEQCINLRLLETMSYFIQDSSVSFPEWKEKLKNIMFFEDKISMDDKRVKIEELLRYFNGQYMKEEAKIIEEIPNFLLDLNTRVVQEFNTLHSYMSHTLFKNHMDPKSAQAILDYYRDDKNNKLAIFLQICNQLYDVILTIALGGHVSSSADPYNLKSPCDKLLNNLINLKITLDLTKIGDILKKNNIPLPMMKNAINFIKNRFLNMLEQKYTLMNNYQKKNNIYELIMKDFNIGYEILEECESVENLLGNTKWQILRNRLNGLMKKNKKENIPETEVCNHPLTADPQDEAMEEKIKILNNCKNFSEILDFLKKNTDFFIDYLDNNKIHGYLKREKYLNNILDNEFVCLL